ncbi:MAG: BMP family ABC transporter substrate-binding protein [Clostridia bacterium]|nr:BMP family ABC transporter substrate-binding protein [Clostridia bacterium]
MKKLLALGLAATLSVAGLATLSACGMDKEDLKIGFIFLHDESSTYDKNFIDAAKAAVEEMGLTEDQVIMKTNIPEDDTCYDTAADLADSGCDIVFADSFGHEAYMMKAAEEFPDVEFCHATGTQAHTAGLDNYHNAFATIYEGRYLAGMVAGYELKEMIDNGDITADQAKMGYVGAFPYAEVVSGFTSFYLGAKSIVEEVTMTVRYTNSWYEPTAEKTTAETLIGEGCVLISQHADSLGAPSACEEAGVPNVSYNGSTYTTGPNTYLIHSRINWQPYFEYIIQSVIDGEKIATDWTGTLETGSVEVSGYNDELVSADTMAAVSLALQELKDGTRHVFDTANFTVGGETLSSYLADVDDDGTFTKETEVIENGIFYESKHRSAPYFDLIIDGITSITSNG